MTMTHHIIRERLRQELDRRDLSAVELARQAGVKTSFLYDILNGKSTNPSTVRLGQVADSLGVSLAWLAGLSEDAKTEQRNGTPSYDYISVPVLTVTQTPSGAQVKENKSGESYYFRKAWLKDTLDCVPEQLRFLTISGDSMEPTLLGGDTVLIDTTRKIPSPPGIFILFDGLGLVAKRLEYLNHSEPPHVRVLSDNPQYSVYERPLDGVQIIGRVIWFSRNL